jgi:serine/threonine protein phosphatase PrpC
MIFIYCILSFKIVLGMELAREFTVTFGAASEAGGRFTFDNMQLNNVPKNPDNDEVNEDRFSQFSNFWAVYDGHGGIDTVEEVKKYFDQNYAILISDPHQIPQAFSTIDLQLKHIGEEARKKFSPQEQANPNIYATIEATGACVVLALLHEQTLYIAHAGDSRAILWRNGTIRALTNDHRLTNQAECTRIEQLGGTHHINKTMKRIGTLQVSRALGDWANKKRYKGTGDESCVSGTPEVTTVNITNQDKFLVLACDGIFDELTNEEVAAIVQQEITKKTAPERIAQSIIQEARRHAEAAAKTLSDAIIQNVNEIKEFFSLETLASRLRDNPSVVTIDQELPNSIARSRHTTLEKFRQMFFYPLRKIDDMTVVVILFNHPPIPIAVTPIHITQPTAQPLTVLSRVLQRASESGKQLIRSLVHLRTH